MRTHPNLGSIVGVEETPIERFSWWSFLPIAIIYGVIWTIPFMGLALVGCNLTYVNLGKEFTDRIFACGFMHLDNATPTVIKSVLLCSTVYFLLLTWATRRKMYLPKYSQKTVIYQRGFSYKRLVRYPTAPSYIFKDIADEITCKYDDISSVFMKISTDLNPRITGRGEVGLVSIPETKIAGGSDKLLFIYNFLSEAACSKEFRSKRSSKFFVSSSKVLARSVLERLEQRSWKEIESKIRKGQVVKFGKFYVCKSYIGLGSKRHENNTFPLHEIQEIELAIDGGEVESWDFFVRFKEEFHKKRMKYASFAPLAPCYHTMMTNVENPHLFLKSLRILGIQVNLSRIYNMGLDEEMVELLKRYAGLA